VELQPRNFLILRRRVAERKRSRTDGPNEAEVKENRKVHLERGMSDFMDAVKMTVKIMKGTLSCIQIQIFFIHLEITHQV